MRPTTSLSKRGRDARSSIARRTGRYISPQWFLHSCFEQLRLARSSWDVEGRLATTEQASVVVAVGSMGIGGSETVTLQVMEELRRRKVAVHVFAVHGTRQDAWFGRFAEIADSVTVRSTTGARRGLLPTLRAVIEESGSTSLACLEVRPVLQLLRRMRSAAPALRVVDTHHIPVGTTSLPLPPACLATRRLIDRHLLVASSQWHSLVHDFGYDRERLLVVPNGVEIDPVPRAPATAVLRLGFCGRLVPEKGPQVAIEAVAALRARGHAVTLAIAGEGPMAADLGRLIESRDLAGSADLMGFVTGEIFMRSVDLLLMPSQFEAAPIVLLEAMAAGAVPICTDVGSVSDAVTDGENGVLIAPGAAEELVAPFTERIAALLADLSVVDRMSEHARATVRSRFGVEQMVERHVAEILGPTGALTTP